MKKSDLDVVQTEFVECLVDAGPIKLLVLLEDFTGWESDAAWDDTEFFFNHHNDFEKIAIVGNPRWEAEVLAFTGAGFRNGPVEFYPETDESEAHAWLAE